ncbi:hypothetical protein V495_00789 [Pseudogymnoascus sp. VKM F-4514 (FW-929)]|nr:hypothetical protein V495_00789 [Pseudogymnoascus sp. VKM F-4514 (FW-929)]KFY56519.1 hypothetical protein V497_06190 [Pseudogymnoascus sp. VKM F-4516 (FW-969)]
MAQTSIESDAAIAIVRQNTEEIQSKGNFTIFDDLWSDDFIDHTPQPGTTPDKAGVLILYHALHEAFPDFHADIKWQSASGNLVTTFKIYHGTQKGPIFGVPPTGKIVEFETVDVMRVVDNKITEHWGVANLLKMMQQIGAIKL